MSCPNRFYDTSNALAELRTVLARLKYLPDVYPTIEETAANNIKILTDRAIELVRVVSINEDSQFW